MIDCPFILNTSDRQILGVKQKGFTIWDVETSKDLLTVSDYINSGNSNIVSTIDNNTNINIKCADINPTNCNIITAGYDNDRCTFWDTRCDDKNGSSMIAMLKENELRNYMINIDKNFKNERFIINDVKFFPDGQSIGIATEYDYCLLYDQRACGIIEKYNYKADKTDPNYMENSTYMCLNEIKRIDWSKSGKYLFVGYQEAPYLLCFDTITGQCVKNVTNKKDSQGSSFGEIYDLAVSPDGERVALAAWLGEAHISS